MYDDPKLCISGIVTNDWDVHETAQSLALKIQFMNVSKKIDNKQVGDKQAHVWYWIKRVDILECHYLEGIQFTIKYLYIFNSVCAPVWVHIDLFTQYGVHTLTKDRRFIEISFGDNDCD